MQFKRLHFQVTVELQFTQEEADFLIERAKTHYDSTCQAAGTSCEEGARTNGFIAQLRLFPAWPAIWTARQIDLSLKILEPYYQEKREALRAKLFNELRLIFESLQKKYGELNA